MIDLLSGLFTPVMNLFLDFLSIQVVFGGLSFPVWAFFVFHNITPYHDQSRQ